MAYCGIDVGTQGVRAVVVAADGGVLGSGQATLRSSRRASGRHEQDPSEWWTALGVAVRAAIEAAAPAQLEAVALDATSGTVLIEDAAGDPRGPALMYDDSRASEQAETAQRVGAELWSALGYRMQPAWALPKLMWLSAHVELASGDRFVHQGDHLVGRLLGEPAATDTSTALKTGVDLRDASWPDAILADLGVPVSRLPEVVLPGSLLGVVGAAASAATGLPAGLPVRAGMTDGCAAQVAAGALAHGRWSSALGTTLVVKGSTAELIRDPSGAVYCHRHPDGGWLPGGASSTGAGALPHWLPGRDLALLTERVRVLQPSSGVTYPLPGRGERFPFVAPSARGFLDPGAVTDAEKMSAICTGVAYIERLAYDALAVLGADVSGPVAFTGGASRNDWWNQLRTDVSGRPTYRPESAESAVGAAIVAAAPPGRLTEAAAAMVRTGDELQPRADVAAELRAGYQRLVERLTENGWLPSELSAAVLARVTSGVA